MANIVTDRVLLRGLDGLYRGAMKQFEVKELLPCARVVAQALQVDPAIVPIEGYYTETPALTNYFRLLRALQSQKSQRKYEVSEMSEFQRLLGVTSSPIFGIAIKDYLLPKGRDSLTVALRNTGNWKSDALMDIASDHARTTDDISLVGLAAFVNDAVLVAALRESVILYAEKVVVMGAVYTPPPSYEWHVTDELAERVNAFVSTFNSLTGYMLPEVRTGNASKFYHAAQKNGIVGRCAHIGTIDGRAKPFYHWAIDKNEQLDEFWSKELRTTERYRESLGQPGKTPDPFDVPEPASEPKTGIKEGLERLDEIARRVRSSP